MNRSIFYCAILLLSLEVYGFSSSPYPDGNVNVFIKDNKPCIYIDKLNLILNEFVGNHKFNRRIYFNC